MCSVQTFNDADIEACNNLQSEPTVSVSLSSNSCKTLSMPDIVQKFSLNTEQLLMYIGVHALLLLHF